MIAQDVLTIGGGSAGLSAALILGRACFSVAVVDDGKPRNSVADKMHGFLSRDGLPPADFLELARSDLARYPSVALARAKIHDVKMSDDLFIAESDAGARYAGRRLLLANGVQDSLPAVEGFAEFWGRGVYVCPFCDGWEIRNKRVVVYGKNTEIIELAQELYGWTRHLVIVAEDAVRMNKHQRRWVDATGCRVAIGTLQRLSGNGGALEAIVLANGERIPCEALFLTAALHQACSIAEVLGCKLDQHGAIIVDDKNQTSVRGCYAAGDAVTDVHQVILAAASGARAAIAICKDLLSEEACKIARGSGV